ncbi:hypothetical protein [Streptomyces sp. NPDC048309]|uniref:hypothetical protein n=1 Tax=unclassified Streptomyces TaxID=2593676 RepID=UPI0033F36548
MGAQRDAGGPLGQCGVFRGELLDDLLGPEQPFDGEDGGPASGGGGLFEDSFAQASKARGRRCLSAPV